MPAKKPGTKKKKAGGSKAGGTKAASKKAERTSSNYFIVAEIDGAMFLIEKVDDTTKGQSRRKNKKFLADHPKCVGLPLYIAAFPQIPAVMHSIEGTIATVCPHCGDDVSADQLIASGGSTCQELEGFELPLSNLDNTEFEDATTTEAGDDTPPFDTTAVQSDANLAPPQVPQAPPAPQVPQQVTPPPQAAPAAPPAPPAPGAGGPGGNGAAPPPPPPAHQVPPAPMADPAGHPSFQVEGGVPVPPEAPPAPAAPSAPVAPVAGGFPPASPPPPPPPPA